MEMDPLDSVLIRSFAFAGLSVDHPAKDSAQNKNYTTKKAMKKGDPSDESVIYAQEGKTLSSTAQLEGLSGY